MKRVMKRVFILLFTTVLFTPLFSQLDITKRTVTLDSISGRQDTIWVTDGSGSVSYIRTSGDSLFFKDVSGEYNLEYLTTSGTGGEVDTNGTPVADQIAYFFTATKIGGTSNFTFDGNTLNLLSNTGTDNLCIGDAAGASIGSGAEYNLFNGINAGVSVTSGDYNILIGSDAGANITTGLDNLIVGNANGSAGMDSCIIIGTYAGLLEATDHRLHIGTLLYGELDNDLFRVNGNFQVTGNFTSDTNNLTGHNILKSLDTDTLTIGTDQVTSIATIDADTATMVIGGNTYKVYSSPIGGAAGNPAGSDGDLQYNDGGSFGGFWDYDDANDKLTIPTGGSLTHPKLTIGASGIYEASAGNIEIVNNGFNVWDITTTKFGSATSTRAVFIDETPNTTNPNILKKSIDDDTGLGGVDDQISLVAGGLSGLLLIENGGVIQVWQTNAGITASTTQSQGEEVLLSSLNEVSIVANANDVVTMPTAQAGMTVRIINNGANTLQIFPSSGDDLGAGVNTSVTLASGSNVEYVAYDDTNWETF